MKLRNTIGKNLSFVAVILLAALAASAQTTSFSYQGRLTDAGSPGNGNFQMQFKLFDAASGGTQIGTTLTDVPVTAAQGNFSLKLDFGASVFTGADRWIEVAVRRNTGESYTTLDPREKIVSSPYSLRTLSAAQADDAQKLGGVNASEYVTGTNPAGNSFIKNQTGQQAASNFNIAGSGTVGSLTSGGAVSIGGTAAPGTAPAGQGRLYFDSGANKFKISENGAAFVNLVGASGVSGSGIANKIPFWSAATTLSDSVITQAGTNIGIGTSSPIAPLTIDAFGHGFNQTNQGVTVGSFVSSTGGWLGTRSNHPLYFFTNNGAPLMTVTQLGNVGIGTTTPGSALELRGSGVQNRISDSVSGNSLVLQGGAGSNMKVTGFNYGTGTAVPLYLSVDGANTFLNSSGGIVGIGTTSFPSGFFRLEVDGGVRNTSSTAAHFVAQTTGGTNSWARYYMRSPNRSWFIGTSQNFNGDQFYLADETAGQTRLSIDTTGKVSLGVLQITGGSDLAENFEFSNKEIKPGMVVAIDPKNAGKLILARGAYNRTVAGIISGANNLSVGMILPDLKEGKNSLPVALSGRVWVYADATRNPIRPGDLLTTSGTPGHAMKVTNHKRANGTIIGKAMSDLKSGTGLVLVLVSLQ
jgi:hypothetical protein